MFTLANDLVGSRMVVQLSGACDTTGAAQESSDQPGAQRYERIEPARSGPAATWYTVFPGGCVTAQLYSTSEPDAAFANQASSVLGFRPRQVLRQELEQRSDGRLRLDPPPG